MKAAPLTTTGAASEGKPQVSMNEPATQAARTRVGLAASAGVLEASDTMTTLHDWVQDKDMVIQPHNPRITYAPEGV